MSKTKSEILFEDFLRTHNLQFDPIEVADSPRPDYIVTIGSSKIVVEVKELSEDENFTLAGGHRKIGDHIRSKISEARKQVQFGSKQGLPSIMLVYNNIDPVHQRFGTEDHDFICAMYGEFTVRIGQKTGKIIDSFHGRNQSLAENKNTSFSALGRLSPSPVSGEMQVTLFENVFAKVPLPYDQLAPCFDVKRVEIDLP
jgi:hypothetical protein